MPTTIEAIYEQGLLRLSRPIDLADGTRVDVIVVPHRESTPTPQAADPTKRQRTPWEIIDEIAALSVQTKPGDLTGRDHDKILYGKP